MHSFEEYKNNLLQDPELKKEWDALDPEFDAIRKDIQSKDAMQQKLSNESPGGGFPQ